MNSKKLLKILNLLKESDISVDVAFEKLKKISFEDIGYAHIDHNRSLRKGFPEIIFGEGKSFEQIIGIIEAILKEDENIIVTRLNFLKAEKILKVFKKAKYDKISKVLTIEKKRKKKKIFKDKKLLIISAGTSDIPVAKEAEIVARVMGIQVETIFDIGVAGVHRLLHYKDKIDSANAIIAIAGMEGALPSVIGGITSLPVIGVPTSVGYGVNFNGVTPLLAMLNSCASNVAVVNIDNGFGAAYFAYSIFNSY